MIPILRAPPLFGRSGRSTEPVHYVAMAFSAGKVDLYTSETGERFRPRGIRGDIRKWMKSGTLRFYTYCPILVHGGALYVCLQHTATGSSVSRALIFKSIDGIEFNRVAHPLEGPGPDQKFTGLAFGVGYIVALLVDGRTVISSDGETFVAGANTGITPLAGMGIALAGSDSALVAGASGGQMRTTSAPQTSWTSRTSQFGTSGIVNLIVGNVFLAAGFDGKIATAALSNVATWTLRTSGTGLLNRAVYRSNRWFVAGDNKWLTATDTLSFSAASDKYWEGDVQPTLMSFVNDGSKILAFYGAGLLAKNEAGTTWTQIDNNGLPAKFFDATAYLP